MDNSSNIDLSEAFKKLLAENKSRQARLEEYEKIIDSRDNEIEVLQTMLSEANAYRSSIDSQLKELEELQRYIYDLQKQVSGSVYMANGTKERIPGIVSAEQQLENLQADYSCLQSKLTDLQTQLLDVNSRNLLLQQQSSRVGELESLLENTAEELENWKNRPKPFDKNNT